jgi:hypothetical protein
MAQRRKIGATKKKEKKRTTKTKTHKPHGEIELSE